MNFKKLFKKEKSTVEIMASRHKWGEQFPQKPVGCSCGNPKIEKLFDADLGWYNFYECEKYNYYWEGPI